MEVLKTMASNLQVKVYRHVRLENLSFEQTASATSHNIDVHDGQLKDYRRELK